MIARTLHSLALLVALAAPAAAVDAPVATDAAPVEASAADWSGPWVGALASAGRIGGGGGLGGVAAGYTLQFDHVVVGVEGDLSGGGLDARRLGGRAEIDAFGGIRGRIGYAFDRFVAYGAAGLAFASTEFVRRGEQDRELQFGWSVGGGVEVAITGSLSARAEYLYVDLDRRSFDAGGRAWYGPSGGLARLGVNYRF